MLYYRLSQYYKELFNCKIKKICVDAGFSCPHIEKTGRGCIYCDNSSFSISYRSNKSVREQIEEALERGKKSTKNFKYIVYFQPNSNTYADLFHLEKIYREVPLEDPRIVGVEIGTRPDCIDKAKLSLIKEIFGNKYIEIYYGLQSSNEKTLSLINRGHTLKEFEKAIEITQKFDIKIGTHVILFLPNESKKDMMNTAKYISSFPIKLVKIHNLYVVKNTPLFQMYKNNMLKLPSLEEYIQTVAEFISYLRKDIVIARLLSDTLHKEPTPGIFDTPKSVIIQKIEAFMREHQLYQGKYYSSH